MYAEIDRMLHENNYAGTWGTDYHDARTLIFAWPEGNAVVQWKDDSSALTHTEESFRNAILNNGMAWTIARTVDEVEAFLNLQGAI